MAIYKIERSPDGFALSLEGKHLLSHSAAAPALFLGRAAETIRMFRGNFEICDRVSQRIAPRLQSLTEGGLVFTPPDLRGELRLSLEERDGLLHLCT